MKIKVGLGALLVVCLTITALAQGYSSACRIVQGKTGQLFAITAQPRKDGKPVSYAIGSAVWSSTNQLAAKVESYKTLNEHGVPVDGTELQALVTLQSQAGSFAILLTVDDGAGNIITGMFSDRAITGTSITLQMIPTAAVDPPL